MLGRRKGDIRMRAWIGEEGNRWLKPYELVWVCWGLVRMRGLGGKGGNCAGWERGLGVCWMGFGLGGDSFGRGVVPFKNVFRCLDIF